MFQQRIVQRNAARHRDQVRQILKNQVSGIMGSGGGGSRVRLLEKGSDDLRLNIPAYQEMATAIKDARRPARDRQQELGGFPSEVQANNRFGWPQDGVQ